MPSTPAACRARERRRARGERSGGQRGGRAARDAKARRVEAGRSVSRAAPWWRHEIELAVDLDRRRSGWRGVAGLRAASAKGKKGKGELEGRVAGPGQREAKMAARNQRRR